MPRYILETIQKRNWILVMISMQPTPTQTLKMREDSLNQWDLTILEETPLQIDLKANFKVSLMPVRKALHQTVVKITQHLICLQKLTRADLKIQEIRRSNQINQN